MKRFFGMFFLALLALPVASAQTDPDLIVFEAGTPIKASDVNSNFQLLRAEIDEVLGAGEVTLDDLDALAKIVDQLQTALTSGDLDGVSLEYQWDGTRLGVRHVGDGSFDYVELVGPTGPAGPTGPTGAAGTPGVDGVDGVDGQDGAPGADGADGADGANGADGLDGAPGAAGADGANGADGQDGRSIEYAWFGTQLGIRYEGETVYTMVDLEGPVGPAGTAGTNGVDGAKGEPGDPGVNGTDGADGTDGIDGRTLLNGAGAPNAALGLEGDFYIDTSGWNIYGPKTGGSWGSATGLIGPTGATGAPGQDGEDGVDGEDGTGAAYGYVTTSVDVSTGGLPDVIHTTISCPASDQLMVDTTITGGVNDSIYGYIVGIEPISSYQSTVTVNSFGGSYNFTIHARCLDPSN